MKAGDWGGVDRDGKGGQVMATSWSNIKPHIKKGEQQVEGGKRVGRESAGGTRLN